MKIKRSSLFIVRFDERPQLDVGAMLRGNLAIVRDEPLVATSLTTGETTALSDDDLRVLRTVSSAEWLAADEIVKALDVDLATVDDLLARALLLGDGEEAPIVAAREREERLTALQWNDEALLYHVTSRISGMDAGAALNTDAATDHSSDVGFASTAMPPTQPPAPPPTPSAVTPFAGAASVISQPAPTWAPTAATPGTAPAPSAMAAPSAPTPTGAFGGQAPPPGFVPQAPQNPGFQAAGGFQAGGFQTPGSPHAPGHPQAPAGFQPPVGPQNQAPADVAQHVAVATVLGQQLQATVAQHGPPPGPFHVPADIQSMHDLPQPTHQGPLIDVLLQRRTVRLYDPAESLTLDELSSLLYFTYGAHGAAQLTPGVVGLRKTSPSGGAMHPIEVFPLILQVQNVPPGIYHYSVERHALSLLRAVSLEEGRQLAASFTSGQSYYATAHALFILTARFFRTYWKYRKSQKAYKVIHLDAGHLSQTLYMMATALGLGAFFTGAVNDIEIETALGLDGIEHGVVGISGCGRPRRDGDVLGLHAQPFTPRASRV